MECSLRLGTASITLRTTATAVPCANWFRSLTLLG